MDSDQHSHSPIICTLPGSCHFLSTCILPSRFPYYPHSNVKGLRHMEVSPLPQTADRVSSTSTVGLLSQAPSPSVLGAAFFCTTLGAETKPVRQYPILDSSQAHLCDTQIQGTHGTVNQSLGWGCEAFPKSCRQEELTWTLVLQLLSQELWRLSACLAPRDSFQCPSRQPVL